MGVESSVWLLVSLLVVAAETERGGCNLCHVVAAGGCCYQLLAARTATARCSTPTCARTCNNSACGWLWSATSSTASTVLRTPSASYLQHQQQHIHIGWTRKVSWRGGWAGDGQRKRRRCTSRGPLQAAGLSQSHQRAAADRVLASQRPCCCYTHRQWPARTCF